MLADIAELVPPIIREALHARLADPRSPLARPVSCTRRILVGPESRGSSPVRIVRDDERASRRASPGLYPVGEGAGYAGGIVSAAVDGLRSAMAVIAKYAPLG